MELLRAASLWYPVMLTQMAGEISQAKAAELLGMKIEDYQEVRADAIKVVMTLIEQLPSPMMSLADILRDRPDLLEPKK